MSTATGVLNLEVRPLQTKPYSHIARDGFVDGALYRQLAGSFPTCRASSGPTGWSLYWGDSEYDELIWEPLTISPAHNRMAAFACAPRSWHLVPEITAQRSPPNFIQVALSSSVDAWQE